MKGIFKNKWFWIVTIAVIVFVIWGTRKPNCFPNPPIGGCPTNFQALSNYFGGKKKI